jgi:predicted secreted hydrolase
MRSRWAAALALFLMAPPLEAQYHSAMPGYRYEFPRDHFNHPDFQTEWWYYTGNVKSADGRCFGFELTFFRQAIQRDSTSTSAWDLRDLYLAHLALSDLDGGRFYHTERTNRAGPGVAGIDQANARIWNGNWEIRLHGDEQELRATARDFALQLNLRSEKRPVINGENGVSQKSSGAGHASHYISLTRLDAKGRISLAGKQIDVDGLAWMDHEFFTHQLEANQVGWDWLSIQVEDHSELMLFHLRRIDGTIDPYSSGTFVDAHGATVHLRNGDFTLTAAGKTWTSPATRATYPIDWKIAIPKLNMEITATTPLPSQELTSEGKLLPTYWEGAITLKGTKAGSALRGVGYLEMTGYAKPFSVAGP